MAVTAPTAGTGKGKLVDIACVVATGFRSSPVNLGRDEVELGKNITAKLMEGEGFIAIDNCTYPISGDLLCSLLTSERVRPAHPRLQQGPIDLIRVLRRGQRE